VPNDIATNPIVVGHEFCGNIVEVGAKWKHKYKAGDKFTIQPALNYKGSMATPGYAYPYMGGDMTYCILAPEVMEMDCLLEYKADAYFYGSVSEPLSCIVGTYHASTTPRWASTST
jgi:threonine dehydrogenase-like Zn-dependent dehydrogenase